MEGSMAEEWNAHFEKTELREVCTNADEVVRAIKNAFPGETSESLSRRAGVSFQTVQRWIGSGRADGTALRRLLAAFSTKKSNKRAYLDEATPKQLYDRCAAIGWDLVMRAGKEIEM
jgi:transposase